MLGRWGRPGRLQVRSRGAAGIALVPPTAWALGRPVIVSRTATLAASAALSCVPSRRDQARLPAVATRVVAAPAVVRVHDRSMATHNRPPPNRKQNRGKHHHGNNNVHHHNPQQGFHNKRTKRARKDRTLDRAMERISSLSDDCPSIFFLSDDCPLEWKRGEVGWRSGSDRAACSCLCAHTHTLPKH